MTDTTSIRRDGTLMYEGKDWRNQAAQTITMMIATAVARPAMINTTRKISRCSVVSPVAGVDESFAIRPLMSFVVMLAVLQ